MENKNTQSQNEEDEFVAKSQWYLMWRKFIRKRVAVVGLVIIVPLVILILGASFFSPYDYSQQNLNKSNIPPQKIHFFDKNGEFSLRPFVYELKKDLDPVTYETIYTANTEKKNYIYFFIRGWEYKFLGLFNTNLHFANIKGDGFLHLLGTDNQGRDFLCRILQGGRISLIVALLGGISTVIIGSLLGGISGYFGGSIDLFIQRVIELIQCFPKLPLWMVLSVSLPVYWPPKYILFGVVGIFALLSWPLLAREVRAKIFSYKEEEFVQAARACGAGHMEIILRHLIPGVASHIITVFTMNVPWLILQESMLSFLGLGIRPPMISWGVLLQKAQNLQTLSQHPWYMLPGLFIIITVLGFNFVGEGLRDAADPYG